MNEVVKYHNKLNNFNYGRFSAVEADIFFSLIAKIKESDGQLFMGFDELKSLSNYYSRDEKRFIRDVENTFEKYLNLKYKEENQKAIVITNVFSRLFISKEKRHVIVDVTPGMEHVILSVSEQFTRFELKEFTQLKSSYSKSLYRLLKQWRKVGRMKISIDDFRFKLDIPKSYRMTNITNTVLNPALKELAAYFKGLSYEKVYAAHKGKGRPAVTALVFTFLPEGVPEAADGVADQDIQDRLAATSDWKKTPRYCPRCKRAMYKKSMKNESGTYYLYGHLDWKTGPCDFSTTHYDELLEKRQVEELKNSETDEANKSKISSLLKNIFK